MRSLKKEVTEEDLKNIFGVYGEIDSVCLKEWKVPPSRIKEG